MLRDEVRDRVIELVNTAAPPPSYNEVVPKGENPLILVDEDFAGWVRLAIDKGDPDPCNSHDPEIIEDRPQLICQALSDNDLTSALLRTTYPVRLCHSPDDEISAYENVALAVAGNPDLIFYQARGSHGLAAAECMMQTLVYIMTELPLLDEVKPLFAG